MHFMKKSWLEFFVKRKITLGSDWKGHPGILDFCRNIKLHIEPSTEIMKDDSASKVVIAPFQGYQLVIKQYNFKSWHKALSRSVRKSKAEKTWDNARYLSLVGIDTVEPVALIEDRLGFVRIRSFFVSSYITGQNAKDFFNDSTKHTSELSTAAESFVKSIHDFHSKGIFIGDTKDINAIIHSGKVFWVDLDGLTSQKWKWIADRKKIKDWKVFLYNWRDNAPVLKLFLKSLNKELSKKDCQKFVTAAAFYTGKKFSSQKPQGGSAFVRKNPDILLSEIKRIAEGDTASGWQRIQSANTAIVARKETKYGNFYCKVFLSRNRFEKIKRFFRPGRGPRAVKSEHMMRAAGFSAPETLLWGSLGEKDYTLSKEIIGIKMVSWLDQGNHNLESKRKILKCLGEKVGALHQIGFSHGDLRLHNILLQENKEEPEFSFLDNERTRLYKKIPRRQAVKNLRQINTDAISRLSRTDRLRIFKDYQKVFDVFTKKEEKRILAEIEKKTQKRLAASHG